MAIEGETTTTTEAVTPSLLGGTTETSTEETTTEETSTTEESTEEETTTEETTFEEKTEEKEEAPGAPEEYADFTLPEGFELNAEIGADFKALGKELNLPQETAQKVIDLGTKLVQNVLAEQESGFKALRESWVAESRKDAEFGGTKLDASLIDAARFRDQYGSPELTELLNSTGLGDHPAMVRLFVRAGKAIGDATFVQPSKTKTATEKVPGQGWYDKSNMKG